MPRAGVECPRCLGQMFLEPPISAQSHTDEYVCLLCGHTLGGDPRRCPQNHALLRGEEPAKCGICLMKGDMRRERAAGVGA